MERNLRTREREASGKENLGSGDQVTAPITEVASATSLEALLLLVVDMVSVDEYGDDEDWQSLLWGMKEEEKREGAVYVRAGMRPRS